MRTRINGSTGGPLCICAAVSKTGLAGGSAISAKSVIRRQCHRSLLAATAPMLSSRIKLRHPIIPHPPPHAKVVIRPSSLGEQMKPLVEDADDNRESDIGLLRVPPAPMTFSDGFDYIELLLCRSSLALARPGHRHSGRQPLQLSTKRLMRLTVKLLADWAAQRTLLSFSLRDTTLHTGLVAKAALRRATDFDSRSKIDLLSKSCRARSANGGIRSKPCAVPDEYVRPLGVRLGGTLSGA